MRKVRVRSSLAPVMGRGRSRSCLILSCTDSMVRVRESRMISPLGMAKGLGGDFGDEALGVDDVAVEAELLGGDAECQTYHLGKVDDG